MDDSLTHARSWLHPSNPSLRVQFSKKTDSRQWAEFRTVPDAMNGVINMYEDYLHKINKGVKNITYKIEHLYRYIDALPQLAAMVQDSKSGQYTPRGKNWFKEKILEKLGRILGSSSQNPLFVFKNSCISKFIGDIF